MRKSPDVPMGAHYTFPLPELRGIFAVRALNLGSDDTRRDGADDAPSDLVLNSEDIFQRTVVAFGPDMVAALGVDKLRCDAHAIASLADGAFKHIAHAEIAADIAYVD